MRKPVNVSLTSPVLVLNRLWQPVHVCSAKRALCLLVLEHAEVVEASGPNEYLTHNYQQWVDRSTALWKSGMNVGFANSPSVTLAFPSIVVLTQYDRLPRRDVRFSRENVYQRDGHQCQYCGERFAVKKLNLDHVIPRQKGGKSTWENVVTSCVPCNSRKANKLPDQANMFPRKTPRMPRWQPLLSVLARDELPHASWGKFIDLPRDQVTVA